MLTNFAEILLKSKIERDNRQRHKKFLPWDKIERIALITNNQLAGNKSAVDKFIEQSGKYIEVFLVETENKEATYADWHCFVKKDRSLFKLPRKQKLEALAGKQFDLVINTCPDDNLFATSLSSALKASLKCGASSRFMDTDLIIKFSEPFNLPGYLGNVVKYLKMIRDV